MSLGKGRPSGPLRGVRVLEIASIGPGPFAGMMLADMGAEVVRIERPPAVNAATGAAAPGEYPRASADPSLRSRRSIVLDLKRPEALSVLMRLVKTSDVLIEGFRPGVAERLGFGPEECARENSRLIFGRITGWGQNGPLAKVAGHDINYLSLTGILHQIGLPGGKPIVPLNAVADFGAGGMLLAYGVMCALFERDRSGKGQVVDATMVDGVLAFMAAYIGLQGAGLWRDETGKNFLAGGAHFYDTYQTRDGKWVAVGAIEPQFHALLLQKLGLAREDFAAGEGYGDASNYAERVQTIWPALKLKLAAAIRRFTRAELEAMFDGSDACLTPVLGMNEAAAHPHNVARAAFINVDGVLQNAPAPRFSRSTPAAPSAPPIPGADARALLTEAGYSAADFERIRALGVLG